MATLSPDFDDFLPGWIATQRWYRGTGRTPLLRRIGGIRWEDPLGEVGRPVTAEALPERSYVSVITVAEIEAGRTYVNVHTNDGAGDPNTGPGDFPGGEVRGQIGKGGDQLMPVFLGPEELEAKVSLPGSALAAAVPVFIAVGWSIGLPIVC